MLSTRRMLVLWLVLVLCVFAWHVFRIGQSGGPLTSEGIYLAGSKIPDERALGGFGEWPNDPRELGGRDWGAEGQISLIAFPSEPASYLNLRGFAVRLVNRTNKPVAFTACDSRLYMVQEALDRGGNWRAIESTPMAICGNSFHRVFLDRDQYWEFPAKRYVGTFKTLLRFRLEQGQQLHGEIAIGDEKRAYIFPRRGGQVVYSNSFQGRINPRQFVTEPTEPE